MSSYRRFISYMYDCRQGQNRKNCGFLKIEVKNNRCIIIFQLKNAPCQDKCNVYLFFRGADPEYLLLQAIPIQKGNTHYKIETSALHMAGQNISFSQCSGILCTDEKGNSCCTSWDLAGELPSYTPITEPEIVTETEPTIEPEIIPESTPIIEPEIVPESTPIMEPEIVPESTPIIQPEVAPKSVTETTEPESDTPSKKSMSFPELWEYMQKEFPALDPFEDNTVVESIKISPSDLGYLQAKGLDLGTNQFLLHGYKSYHHLLLGRLRGQMQYVIGIPGIYDPQEQFMAKMFGFPCFKPIRECRQKNGQFGYWLRCFR